MIALAVLARLVAPTSSSTITVSDVESTARSAVEWFVDVRLLAREEAGRGLEDLRSCATDNRCIAARLEQHGIERALYVVVSLETGFATAELLSKGAGEALATEAVPIEGAVESAVALVVTNAMTAAGHRRGARLTVDVVPRDAVVLVGSAAVSSGEAIVVAAGEQWIEATADGFEPQRRAVALEAGDEVALKIQLAEEASIIESWWLWTAVGLAAAAIVVVPIVAVRASADLPTVCYGDDRALCEMQR